MLKPHTIIGDRYRVCHLLAEGGTSEVYLAQRCYSSGRLQFVVLKKLTPAVAFDPLFVGMFRQEAKILKLLNHENIVGFLDFFEEHGSLYLVLEHVCGKDLASLMPIINKLSPRERRQTMLAVGLKLVEAFHYMEKLGDATGPLRLIHGDISPSNILVSLEGRVVILDFGASQSQSWQNACSNIINGRLRYMAPEVLAGEPIDARSDIFSLGLVLFEIAFGRSIYENLDEEKISARIRDDQELCEHLPVTLKSEAIAILGPSLKKKAQDRFSSFAEFHEHLSLQAKDYDLTRPDKFLVGLHNQDISSTRAAWWVSRVHANGWQPPLLIIFLLALSVTAIALIHALGFKEKPWQQGPEDICEVVLPAETESRAGPEEEKAKEESGLGRLNVLATPWAHVFVDDEYLGVTPLGSIWLVPGTHLVQLKNPDFSTVVLRQVAVYANKKTNLIHQFQSEE